MRSHIRRNHWHATLTCALLSPLVLRADNHVDLVCQPSENTALIRFAITEADAPPKFPLLPAAIDHGLSKASGRDRTDCRLANQEVIRIRAGEEQAFPYGMGGADPPAFFSLWINKRKIYSKKVWKPGYQDGWDGLPIINGVVISGNQFTICSTAEDKPQTCARESIDLDKATVDEIEYPPSGKRADNGLPHAIAHRARDQQFCNAYLQRLKPNLFAALLERKTPFLTDMALTSQRGSLTEPSHQFGLVALSPGTKRQIVIWSAETHYFDGDVILIAPPEVSVPQIIASYPFDAVEDFPKRPIPNGWTLISGGQTELYSGESPRHVHFIAQRIDGVLYFLAVPLYWTAHPMGTLVKPLPQGGFVNVCAFDQTDVHY